MIDQALAIDPQFRIGVFHARDVGERRQTRCATPCPPRRRGDPSNGRGLTAYAAFLSTRPTAGPRRPRACCSALWIDPMSRLGSLSWPPIAALTSRTRKLPSRRVLEVLQLDPDFVPGAGALRHSFDGYLHGQLAEAIQVLEHAIKLDPASPSLRHNAMAVYLDLGDEPAAREVAAGTPQSARAVGLLAMYRGDWRAAAALPTMTWAGPSTPVKNWLAAEALRDDALKTGRAGPGHLVHQSEVPAWRQSGGPTWKTATVARLSISRSSWRLRDRRQAATELRRAAAAWLDANSAKYLGGTHVAARERPVARRQKGRGAGRTGGDRSTPDST